MLTSVFLCLRRISEFLEVSTPEIPRTYVLGLLSAHLLITDTDLPLMTGARVYNGELLELAFDLGNRLLPAFMTTTGIPFGTV